MKVLFHHLKKYKLQATLSTLFVVVMVISQLWQPKLLQQVLDAIMKDDMDEISSIGALLIGIAAVGLIAGILNTILSAKVAQASVQIFVNLVSVKSKHFHSATSKNFRQVI